MSYHILILDNIAKAGLAQFSETFHATNPSTHPEAILLRSFKLTSDKIPPSVNVIVRAGAGVNNIPIDQCTQRGIPVLNTPGANANAVKELVLTGMLMASRHITRAWDYTKQLTGDEASINSAVEKNKKQFAGTELANKTLGVIGLGNIGLRVANAAIDLGMKVIGYDELISVKHAWQLSSDVMRAEKIEEVLKNADYISLHIPLNEKTHHLVNKKWLQKMKKNAVLLNFSRADIVEKTALLEALKNHLHYYVCDFPSRELMTHPNVICLPHLGASTKEAEENCAVMAVNQIQAFLNVGEIKNSVNFPDVKMPYSTGYRVSIVNANIPNMLAQISSVFSKNNLNIIDMLNKSRGDIAYTLIDVEKPISQNLLSHLANIEGVIKVRALHPLPLKIQPDIHSL